MAYELCVKRKTNTLKYSANAPFVTGERSKQLQRLRPLPFSLFSHIPSQQLLILPKLLAWPHAGPDQTSSWSLKPDTEHQIYQEITILWRQTEGKAVRIPQHDCDVRIGGKHFPLGNCTASWSQWLLSWTISNRRGFDETDGVGTLKVESANTEWTRRVVHGFPAFFLYPSEVSLSFQQVQ